METDRHCWCRWCDVLCYNDEEKRMKRQGCEGV